MGTDGLPKGPSKNALSPPDVKCHERNSSDFVCTGWESRMLPNPAIPSSFIAVRSTEEHTARRRLWARGFTASAIKGYHLSLVKRANQLVDMLTQDISANKDKQGVVDVAEWIGYFAFDFMGDMV